MKNDTTQVVPLEGFRFIIADGDCKEHGYFLPKQDASVMTKISNAGVEVVDVPITTLCDAIASVGVEQTKRLKESGLSK